MKILLNGRKVGNGYIACYFENKAFFIKKGLKKRIELHEFYHHLIAVSCYELKKTIEEKEANSYARDFMKQNDRVRSKGQGRWV